MFIIIYIRFFDDIGYYYYVCTCILICLPLLFSLFLSDVIKGIFKNGLDALNGLDFIGDFFIRG